MKKIVAPKDVKKLPEGKIGIIDAIMNKKDPILINSFLSLNFLNKT